MPSVTPEKIEEENAFREIERTIKRLDGLEKEGKFYVSETGGDIIYYNQNGQFIVTNYLSSGKEGLDEEKTGVYSFFRDRKGEDVKSEMPLIEGERIHFILASKEAEIPTGEVACTFGVHRCQVVMSIIDDKFHFLHNMATNIFRIEGQYFSELGPPVKALFLIPERDYDEAKEVYKKSVLPIQMSPLKYSGSRVFALRKGENVYYVVCNKENEIVEKGSF